MTDAARSSIWGRVVDALGGPLPGAEIFWLAPEHEGAETVPLLDVHRVAVADDEGRFWAPDIPPGRCVLLPDFHRIGVVADRVEAGHGAVVEAPLAEGEEVVLTYPFRPGSFGRIHGRLHDSVTSLPVSGYPIFLVDPETGRRRDALSDENGEFGFVFLPAGSYVLAFPGSPEYQTGQAPVEVKGGSNVEAKVGLHARPFAARHVARIHVVNDAGEPVAGAEVDVGAGNEMLAKLETSADGWASDTDLYAAPDVALAKAEGCWPAGAKFVVGPDGEATARIVLRRAVAIEISVRDASDDSVLRYANVRVHHDGGDAWEWGGVMPAPGAPPRDRRESLVVPGPVTIRAEAPGYEGAEQTVDVPLAGLPEPVTLRITPR